MKRLLTGLFFLCFLVACGGDQPTPNTFSVSLGADKLTGPAPLLVNFSASVPDADNSVGYNWTFGAGQTEQGSASRAYTFTEAGSYDVTVEAIKGDLRANNSVKVEVSAAPAQPDNQAPVVELSATTTSGKAPLPIEFSAAATDPDGDPLTYAWNFGDAATVAASGEPSQSHTFESAGSYEATVTVSDGRGGTAQASLQIAIADPNSGGGEVPNPPGEPSDNEAPVVTLSANTLEGTAPLTVSFGAEVSDPDDDPLTYAWVFGNGETAEGNTSQTVVYNEPGTYTAKVAVSDGIATTEKSLVVLVNASNNTAPNVPPAVTISATPTSGKAPLPVKFSADVSDPDSPMLSYVWDFGDGTISGEDAPTHSYTEVGDYTASLTVGDREGGKTRKEVTITVAPGSGDPGTPDVPFYGEWAWAAKSPDGKSFEGFVSISESNPEPLPDNVIEGGMGAWTHCLNGSDACADPTGIGHIDVVDYGMGDQYDIVFINNAGATQLVAFDDDDKLGSEIDGAPTFKGGGAWYYDNGSSDDLTFAMVKVGGKPATAMTAALSLLGENMGRSH